MTIALWLYFWGAVNFWVDLRHRGMTAALLCIFWPITVPAAFLAAWFP